MSAFVFLAQAKFFDGVSFHRGENLWFGRLTGTGAKVGYRWDDEAAALRQT
jgi:hypothetical protein